MDIVVEMVGCATAIAIVPSTWSDDYIADEVEKLITSKMGQEWTVTRSTHTRTPIHIKRIPTPDPNTIAVTIAGMYTKTKPCKICGKIWDSVAWERYHKFSTGEIACMTHHGVAEQNLIDATTY